MLHKTSNWLEASSFKQHIANCFLETNSDYYKPYKLFFRLTSSLVINILIKTMKQVFRKECIIFKNAFNFNPLNQLGCDNQRQVKLTLIRQLKQAKCLLTILLLKTTTIHKNTVLTSTPLQAAN